MDVSILLARIIGPTFFVVGIGVLLNAAYYVDMVKSFVENKEHYYFSGVAALIVGISIVLFHNIWVADWRLLITLIGWASIVKGISRILFPRMGAGFVRDMRAPDWLIYGGSFVIVILGGWLSFEGFFVV